MRFYGIMNSGIGSTNHFEEFPNDWQSSLQVLNRLHNLLAICHGDTILHLNPRGCELLGLEDSQAAIQRSFFSFAHRDYAELAELGLSVFAEESTAVAMKLVRQDGSDIDVEIWVTPFGEGGFHLVEAHDITEHLRSARALRQREQRLEGIINTVADGIVTVDDSGLVQTFNPAAEAIFGFHKEEVIGRSIRSLIPDALIDARSDSDWARKLSAGGSVVGKRKTGDVVDLEVAVRELQQGEHISFTGIMRDITARKAAEARIFHMAHHDALTGLPNRHLFTDRVEEAFKRAKRHHHKLGLLFLDLDKFKPINDTYGHAVGDEVLKEVANRLRRVVRVSDTVARAGGDEFLVLLEELITADDAQAVCNLLHQELSQPMVLSVATLEVGASIGIALYPDDAEDMVGLMDHADRAMYLEKHRR